MGKVYFSILEGTQLTITRNRNPVGEVWYTIINLSVGPTSLIQKSVLEGGKYGEITLGLNHRGCFIEHTDLGDHDFKDRISQITKSKRFSKWEKSISPSQKKLFFPTPLNLCLEVT